MRKRNFAIVFLPILFLAKPILNFFQNKVWLAWGYPNHYFGFLDVHNNPFYLWKEIFGEPNAPRLLDISYYLPFKIISLIVDNSYFSWLVYVFLVLAASAFLFSLYIRKVDKSLSLPVSLILGLVYASYLPLNYEGFNLRLAGALIPFLLWLIIRTYENAKQSILGISIGALLVFNLTIVEQRSFIAFLILAISHVAFLARLKRDKQSILRTLIFLVLIVVGGVILFLPTKYAQDLVFNTSVQISAQTQESVLTRFFSPLKFLLHPNPSMPQNFACLACLAVFFGLAVWSLSKMFQDKDKIIFLVWLLICAYFLLLSDFFLRYLSLTLPYGQLFRSWRIAQYLGSFLVPLVLVKLVQTKRQMAILTVFVLGYFSLSAFLFSQNMTFVKKTDIQPYVEANRFLQQDFQDFKVVWIPEMGWFGENSRPFWATNNDTMQGFPEYISSKPGYWHYTNQMTHFYTWAFSGIWKSVIQENKNSSDILKILGAKYVVVHNDVPGYEQGTKNIVNNLSSSPQFKLVWQKDYLSIFENLDYKSRIWATSQENALFCDYGLKCLEDFYGKADPYKTTVFVSDSELKAEVFEKIHQVFYVNTKNEEEKFYNLLIGKILTDKNSGTKIIFSKDYLKYQQYAACLSDTHHGTYHDFFQQQPPDFANGFGFQNCLFFLGPNQYSKIYLPFSIKNGDYVVLIRYLQQGSQAGFKVSLPGFAQEFISPAKDGLIGYIYFRGETKIASETESEVILANLSGINFINLIALIPKQEFENNLDFFKSRLREIQATETFPNSSLIIKKVERINPVKWEVNLFADKPFVLSFAESYNPFWKAIIFKNSQKVGETYSVQSYASVNSFFVDQTGDLKVEIVYEPQEKYQRYALASFLGLGFVMVFYLVIKKILFKTDGKLLS